MRCPICQREFDPATSTALPFCSERCRRIDLKRWLGEEYAVPQHPDEEDESPSTLDEPPDDVDAPPDHAECRTDHRAEEIPDMA